MLRSHGDNCHESPSIAPTTQTMTDPSLKYREQHKQRLSYMPWLYWSLKPAQRQWAEQWQKQWQAHLQEMETVEIHGDCFISPLAALFAERGRPIQIMDGAFIAADCVLHGPISIGENVGVNHHVTMDGGKRGVVIGDHCRIAAYCALYAFNHQFEKNRLIHEQKVSSKGIRLGRDVWLGSHVSVMDGVEIKDGAVIGARSVVTKNVASNIVAAGNPAKKLKDRH